MAEGLYHGRQVLLSSADPVIGHYGHEQMGRTVSGITVAARQQLLAGPKGRELAEESAECPWR